MSDITVAFLSRTIHEIIDNTMGRKFSFLFLLFLLFLYFKYSNIQQKIKYYYKNKPVELLIYTILFIILLYTYY